MFGARVLAIASSDEKAAKLKEMGAEVVVNYTDCRDWDSEILALTDGPGVDKIIDIAWEMTIQKSAAAARVRGEIALVGAMSVLGGSLAPVDVLWRLSSFSLGLLARDQILKPSPKLWPCITSIRL